MAGMDNYRVPIHPHPSDAKGIKVKPFMIRKHHKMLKYMFGNVLLWLCIFIVNLDESQLLSCFFCELDFFSYWMSCIIWNHVRESVKQITFSTPLYTHKCAYICVSFHSPQTVTKVWFPLKKNRQMLQMQLNWLWLCNQTPFILNHLI